MTTPETHPITAVTRKAIFKELTNNSFNWKGDASDIDVLSRVFPLKDMPPCDDRFSNFKVEIERIQDSFDPYELTWIYTDKRLDLLGAPEGVLLDLLSHMAHPDFQSDPQAVSWFIGACNRHLAFDGWKLVPKSHISGRPVYGYERREPASPGDPTYKVPIDLDIDLESYVYSISQVFAYIGKSTEVAVLANAAAELTQTGYDTLDGGTYTYALALLVPPTLYAQVSETRSEIELAIRDEMKPHFPHQRNLQEVSIRPYRQAPANWQRKAKKWVEGKGLTNQGRVRSTNIASREFDGLLFRSQPEIHLYQALKQKGVAFAPLPVFLRGGENYQRLEPDFVVIKDGIVAVVEVDGDSFHPETPASAQTRLKILENAGAFIIRVEADSCKTKESAEAKATEILADINTHKNNRR